MSVSAAFRNHLKTGKTDLRMVYELYPPSAVPGASGFDPADAIETFAGAQLTWRSIVYRRQVTGHGKPRRTTTPEFNSVSVNFSNLDDYMEALFLSLPQGVTGYHLVQRIITPGLSSSLDDSVVLFTGKSQKPVQIDRKTFQLSAKQHLGTITTEIPPRTFSPDDKTGRAPTDIEFEGYRFTPQQFQLQYREKVRKGGILGIFGLKKNVTRTLTYSSYSDVDANSAVPIVLGRSQILFKTLAAVDIGNSINCVYAACEGPIEGFGTLRIITPGFTGPFGVHYRYGYPAGVGGQVPVFGPGASNYPGNAHYSRTAWVAMYFNGSGLDQDDPAPEVASIIKGAVVPLPDGSGDFTLEGFTDNPAYLARWIITDPRLMNLDPAFIDDAVCVETARWCEQYIVDEANTDTVALPLSEGPTALNPAGRAGVDYNLYNSTGRLTPQYIRSHVLGEPGIDPWLVEADYNFFDPLDTAPVYVPQKLHRRRYTANSPITEKQKAIDFLNNILLPSSRLYLSQGQNGKVGIKVKRPADYTFVRDASVVAATEIAVQSVLAWLTDLRGKVVIGANLLTSEVRVVTATRYSTAGNSITLAATNLTASGATFAGGDGATVTATAWVQVTDTSGQKVITIDGVDLAYTPQAGDTTASVAYMLSAFVLADPTVGQYVKAEIDAGDHTKINLSSKLGFLRFPATPLANAHDTLEEIVRVEMSFDRGASQISDSSRSNIIKDTFKWPLGSRQSVVNQVILRYRDASQDYRSVELIVNDEAHQAATKEVHPLEVNGACIDNYAQAVIVANGYLAELRDGDFFTQHSSDGEALLLEEGQVIAICHDSGNFVNLIVRVEDLQYSDDFAVEMLCRRYLTSMYDDEVSERVVPLPTTLKYSYDAPPPATALVLTETGSYATDGAWKARIHGTFDFGLFPGEQFARVEVRRTGEADFKDTNNLVRPDALNQGTFEILDAGNETYEVRVVTESKYGKRDTAGALTGSLLVFVIPPPLLPTGLTLTRSVGSAPADLHSTWMKGIRSPAPLRGEEIEVYLLRIKSGGVLKRQVTLRVHTSEPVIWTLDPADAGIPSLDPTIATVAADGTISTAGHASKFASAKSQDITSDALIQFNIDSRYPPLQFGIIPGSTGQVFTVDPATDVFTLTAHGLNPNQRVKFVTTGTLPAPLTDETTIGEYYVVAVTDDTFKIAITANGAPVDITTAGTGVHTIKGGPTGVFLDTIIESGVPKIRPELDASKKRQAVAEKSYAIEVLNNSPRYFEDWRGKESIPLLVSREVPLADVYRAYVTMGLLGGEAQAAIGARITRVYPRQFTYTREMQQKDFTGETIPATVDVEVAQVSSLVGPGPFATETG